MRRFPRFLLAVLAAAALGAAPTRLEALWKALRSESFTLFYPAGREREALDCLRALEGEKDFAESLVGREGRRLSVVLVDAGTESNGYADPFFRRIHLYTYPPGEGQLAFAPNWWGLVGLHEYVHWLQLTQAYGLPGALAWAFGDAWAPGLFNPDWLVEGLAVYAESAVGPYQGRLNAGLFDAYLEALLQARRGPTLPQALFAPDVFPGATAPYLYGGEFVGYLARTYGQQSLTRLLHVSSASALSYLTPLLPLAGLDRSARRVFGKRTSELWRDWLKARCVEAAAAAPPDGAQASEAAWWMGRPVPREGRVYFLRSSPYPAGPLRQSWRHELRVLEPAGERTLARFASAFTGDLKLREGRLYLAVEDLEGGRANTELLGFGATSVLYSVDLAGGGRTRVLRAPFRAYEVLPGGDVVFTRDRTGDFGSEVLLWKRRPAAGQPNPTLLLRSDWLVREILVSEGRIFVSARRNGENFGLYEADPQSYRLSPILPSPYSAGSLSFAEGRLLFAANYGGRFAVYTSEPDGEGLGRLTRSAYADGPALDEEGVLWFVGLGPQGYALRRVEPTPQPVTPPTPSGPESPGSAAVAPRAQFAAPASAIPPSAIPPSAPVEFQAGGYGWNLLTLAPRLLTPWLTLDTAQGSYLAGAAVFGTSALGDISYEVTGLVDVSTGAPAAAAWLGLISAPVSWSLAASSLDGGWVEASAEVPVLRRLAPVERSLSLGLSASLYGEGFTGRALEPFLHLAVGWPLDRLAASLSLPFERVELGAAQNQAWLQGGLSLAHLFRFGSLRLEAEGFVGLDGGAGLLAPLRGNTAELPGQAAAAANLDFSIRMLQIRAGAWNPPIFLQDVYLVPFAGAAVSDLGQYQVAAGLELHWELKVLAVATGLPLDLRVGLAVNGEGTLSLFTGLVPLLEGLPLGGVEPRRRP